MLDSGVVKIFEKHTVCPPFFELRYFICCFHGYLFLVHTLRHTEFLQGIWLHKQSKSVSGYFFSSDLVVSNDTMGSGLQIATADNLSHLTQLESEHVGWNGDSGHFGEPIFGEESSVIMFEFDLFSGFVNVHGRSQ